MASVRAFRSRTPPRQKGGLIIRGREREGIRPKSSPRWVRGLKSAEQDDGCGHRHSFQLLLGPVLGMDVEGPKGGGQLLCVR